MLIGLGIMLPLVGGVLGLLLMYWVLYSAIKAGVRDGISEARFKLPNAATSQAPTAPQGFKWVLERDDMPDRSRLDELRID